MSLNMRLGCEVSNLSFYLSVTSCLSTSSCSATDPSGKRVEDVRRGCCWKLPDMYIATSSQLARYASISPLSSWPVFLFLKKKNKKNLGHTSTAASRGRYSTSLRGTCSFLLAGLIMDIEIPVVQLGSVTKWEGGNESVVVFMERSVFMSGAGSHLMIY